MQKLCTHSSWKSPGAILTGLTFSPRENETQNEPAYMYVPQVNVGNNYFPCKVAFP